MHPLAEGTANVDGTANRRRNRNERNSAYHLRLAVLVENRRLRFPSGIVPLPIEVPHEPGTSVFAGRTEKLR